RAQTSPGRLNGYHAMYARQSGYQKDADTYETTARGLRTFVSAMNAFRATMMPALCVLLSACMAQRVLYRATDADRRLLAEPPLDYTVGVSYWDPGSKHPMSNKAYARGLYDLLRHSGAFKSVQYDTARTQP